LNDLNDLNDTSFTHLDVFFSTDFINPPEISKVLLTDHNKIIQLNHEKILLDNFFSGYDFMRDSHYSDYSLNYNFYNNSVIITAERFLEKYLCDDHDIESLWVYYQNNKVIHKVREHSFYNGK
jgi:hypothetical protein